jgi:hypothetical protein
MPGQAGGGQAAAGRCRRRGLSVCARAWCRRRAGGCWAVPAATHRDVAAHAERPHGRGDLLALVQRLGVVLRAGGRAGGTEQASGERARAQAGWQGQPRQRPVAHGVVVAAQRGRAGEPWQGQGRPGCCPTCKHTGTTPNSTAVLPRTASRQRSRGRSAVEQSETSSRGPMPCSATWTGCCSLASYLKQKPAASALSWSKPVAHVSMKRRCGHECSLRRRAGAGAGAARALRRGVGAGRAPRCPSAGAGAAGQGEGEGRAQPVRRHRGVRRARRQCGARSGAAERALDGKHAWPSPAARRARSVRSARPCLGTQPRLQRRTRQIEACTPSSRPHASAAAAPAAAAAPRTAAKITRPLPAV